MVLDANGEADVWLSPSLSYKFILKSSADATQWTKDNVTGAVSLAAGAIGTTELANDAVTADKLADHASDDSARAVTTNHLKDDCVTAGKLATNVVDNSTLEHNGGALRIKDAGVTQAKKAIRSVGAAGASVAAGGVAISASSGLSATVDGTTFTTVANLSVTIETLGSPVELKLQPDGAQPGYIEWWNTGQLENRAEVAILRNGAIIRTFSMRDVPSVSEYGYSSGNPSSVISMTDTGATAGSNVYTVQIRSASSYGHIRIWYSVLVGYELG